MNPKQIKEELLNQCWEYVNQRVQRIQNTISDIQESLTSETKSSAGDKHETGRAMLQLEREKAGRQLAEVQKLQEVLAKLTLSEANHICLGSLVITSQNNYFISISVGQLIVDSIPYFAIAPNSPIGNLLLGKTTREAITFRDKIIKITIVH